MPKLIQLVQSKTLLFATILAVLSAAQTLIPFLPMQYVGPVGLGVAVIVTVLRILTTVPLDQK